MAEARSFASRLFSTLLLIAVAAGAGAAAMWFLRPQGPDVELLTPVRARPGEVVTLKGSRFAPAPQGVIVLFGDKTGPVVNASADEIRAAVPALSLEGPAERHVAVRVLVGDRASTPFDLTVYAPATEAPEATEVPAAEEAPAPPTTTVPATLPPAPQRPPTTQPAAVAAAPPPTAPPATAPRAVAAPRPAVAPQPRPTARPTPASTPAPAPPPTAAPRPPAEPPKAPAPKSPPRVEHTFVLERSAAVNNKRAATTLAGFDSAGVDLKRGPEVPGRIDFEITPSRVKAGDRYTVTAFLINDGSKAIRIKEMFVATTRNGVLSAAPVPPKNRDVATRQRQVIGVFSDVWREDVVAWAMDVTVTSDRADVYKNQVTWK
jgi:IPT/TIG domain